jgi:hypothetical protein
MAERHATWPISVVALLAVAAALTGFEVLFAPDTALLAIVPMPATIERFAALIAAGELSIAEQSIPAIADDGIRFLLAAGIAAFALLVDGAAGPSRSSPPSSFRRFCPPSRPGRRCRTRASPGSSRVSTPCSSSAMICVATPPSRRCGTRPTQTGGST